MNNCDDDGATLTADEVVEIEDGLFEINRISLNEDTIFFDGGADDDEQDIEDLLSDYTYSVWINDAAETVLGKDKFLLLIKRIAQIEGVERVLHEDTEILYIRAPMLDETELCDELRNTYFELKAEEV